MIDTRIVEAAQRGDKQSFAQVYDWIAPDLYRVALYTLGNPHDAEDVVSETFIEAYKGISGLRDPEKIKPWMMRILSIRCKRKIGTYVQGRQKMNLDDVIYGLSDGSNLSSEVSEMVDVMDAMAELTEEERLIITLATIQGYTVREVAEFLDMPQGTVSSKLYRALDKVREILEQSETQE